jgi:hypothetical protein
MAIWGGMRLGSDLDNPGRGWARSSRRAQVGVTFGYD